MNIKINFSINITRVWFDFTIKTLKAIHIEVRIDNHEWTAMKFSMYEVIEIFRSQQGIRANVAIKILMAGLMAIQTNAQYNIQIMQR